MAIDWAGPKWSILVSISFMVAGCFVFALGTTASGVIAGRALMGIGTGSFLIAPLAIYARWFAPSRFSTLAGIQVGVGTVGALLATAPLAVAAASFGWRETFMGVGAISVCVGLLVWLLVNDNPPGSVPSHRRETLRESLTGVMEVIRTPSIFRVFLVQLTSYPSFLLVIGLWGGPYLTHIYGLDLTSRGEILFIPALAQAVGSFAWGPMDRIFGSHKRPVLIAMGVTTIVLLSIAGLGNPPLPVLIALLAVLGFTTGITPLLVSHGKSLIPPPLIGRGMTLLNMGTMGGGFLSQMLSGTVINLFPVMPGGAYPLDAYRLVFALQALFTLVAILFYLASRDPAEGGGKH
jgi:MFS family permease